jgi:hypothetical protein
VNVKIQIGKIIATGCTALLFDPIMFYLAGRDYPAIYGTLIAFAVVSIASISAIVKYRISVDKGRLTGFILC